MTVWYACMETDDDGSWVNNEDHHNHDHENNDYCVYDNDDHDCVDGVDDVENDSGCVGDNDDYFYYWVDDFVDDDYDCVDDHDNNDVEKLVYFKLKK